MTTSDRPTFCFNPCCGGIPLMRTCRNLGSQGRSQFQSLLWWNTSNECNTYPPSKSIRKCFNPCCGGIPLMSPTQTPPYASLRGFNPCCGGIPLMRYGNGGRRKMTILCFNPCCGGIPLMSHKAHVCIGSVLVCVSILVVVEYL